ncbi:MAG: glycine--tRNA ligase subunit beta [Rickettsiaceae bacterium]
MSELLLELFSEEIPAMMQQKAAQGYKEIFTNYFKEKKINFVSVDVYVGPRRVAIHAAGVSPSIEANVTEIKGPKTSAPIQAIEGFCQSNKISQDELKTKEINGVGYFIFEQKASQQLTKDILTKDLPNLISAYVWPKSMYWGDYKIRWVRPLKNIMCLFDGNVLSFEYGHLKANNESYGHRFMGASAPFKVSGFVEYKQKLLENFVLLDQEERKEYIIQESQKIASKMGLLIKNDPELIEEVTGLVEYPQILVGKVDKKFLSVPSEVLVSSMRSHQKYFSLFDQKGNFAPYFLFVSNIVSTDPDVVVNGNEKVLSARLSDALYFYNQDLKTPMEHRVNKLDKVVFHAKLGSLKDKVLRLADIVSFLSPGNEELKKAALLCKNDIVSEVVGEFPNLQGVMGYYYAKAESMSEDLSVAIRDHYKPQGASDECPSGGSAILALADKIDSLCGLMLAGERASGSKDPYALRRQALGVIRIILENRLEINIVELVDFVLGKYQAELDGIKKLILEFLEERLRHFLKDNYSHELIAATLNFAREPSLVEIQAKLQSLKEFLSSSNGNDLLVAYKRASNIASTADSVQKVDESLLSGVDEKALYEFIKDYTPKIESAIRVKDYDNSLKMLAGMKAPISSFFDNVMVKVEDKAVAANRLALLLQVKQIFNQIADFDEL